MRVNGLSTVFNQSIVWLDLGKFRPWSFVAVLGCDNPATTKCRDIYQAAMQLCYRQKPADHAFHLVPERLAIPG